MIQLPIRVYQQAGKCWRTRWWIAKIKGVGNRWFLIVNIIIFWQVILKLQILRMKMVKWISHCRCGINQIRFQEMKAKTWLVRLWVESKSFWMSLPVRTSILRCGELIWAEDRKNLTTMIAKTKFSWSQYYRVSLLQKLQKKMITKVLEETLTWIV